MATPLYCPDCHENLGKDVECFNPASCSTCGRDNITNPRGERWTPPPEGDGGKAAPARPRLNLVGEDGNAFAIPGKAMRAARKAGWPQERIDQYKREATGGNYDALLATTMRYFDVR